MKFLAIEKEKASADWSDVDSILIEEAKHVYRLYLEDTIREIYFNEQNCAVLTLECKSRPEAEKLLSDFPLVRAGFIEFKLTQLKPYTGFNRLMNY